ncbi:MAG: hypothetical protein VX304_07390, partial [Planctomycetota bacterium]|nr:hypothetical protein [Planctomycetota bacterium]
MTERDGTVDSELVDGLGVMHTTCFRALVVAIGFLVSASCGADPAKPDSGSNAAGLQTIAIGEKVPDFSFV